MVPGGGTMGIQMDFISPFSYSSFISSFTTPLKYQRLTFGLTKPVIENILQGLLGIEA